MTVVPGPALRPNGVPHMSFPLRLQGSRFSTVQQDSPEEVGQRVRALLRTPRGSREENPDLGIPFPGFRRGGTDLVEIARQIDTYAADEGALEAVIEEDYTALQDALSEVQVSLLGESPHDGGEF
jgi:hypothetical protein